MTMWGLGPREAMALTDEQFNALMCRAIERLARERAARPGNGSEREVTDETALRELGVTVERYPVNHGD